MAIQSSEPVTPGRKPAAVYGIALFFTAVWLFTLVSVLYVLFHTLTTETRHRLVANGVGLPLLIAQVNGLLTAVGAWLLVAMRRVGAGLLLASTVLVLGIAAISWPAVLARYQSAPSAAALHSLLLSGSNILLHVAATVYAFSLNRRGLLR